MMVVRLTQVVRVASVVGGVAGRGVGVRVVVDVAQAHHSADDDYEGPDTGRLGHGGVKGGFR